MVYSSTHAVTNPIPLSAFLYLLSFRYFSGQILKNVTLDKVLEVAVQCNTTLKSLQISYNRRYFKTVPCQAY